MKAIRIKDYKDLEKGEFDIPSGWNMSGKMDYLYGTVHIIDQGIIERIEKYQKQTAGMRDSKFCVPDTTKSTVGGMWYIYFSDVDIIDSITHPEEFT